MDLLAADGCSGRWAQVRTVKFMNKLNQLKSREGFEGFGSIISLFR